MAQSTTGLELRRLRESTGITQAELSREAGVTVPAVYSVEGAEQLRPDTFWRYALAISRLHAANQANRALLARTLIQAGLDLLNEIDPDTSASGRGADAA